MGKRREFTFPSSQTFLKKKALPKKKGKGKEGRDKKGEDKEGIE